MKKKFTGVLAYFGEDPNTSSMDFFSTLSKFVQVSFLFLISFISINEFYLFSFKEFVEVRESVGRIRRLELKKQRELEASGDPNAAKAAAKPSRRHSMINQPTKSLTTESTPNTEHTESHHKHHHEHHHEHHPPHHQHPINRHGSKDEGDKPLPIKQPSRDLTEELTEEKKPPVVKPGKVDPAAVLAELLAKKSRRMSSFT